MAIYNLNIHHRTLYWPSHLLPLQNAGDRFERMRACSGALLGLVLTGLMTEHVKTARDTTPIVELVPLMTDAGLHHLAVANDESRFVGIVT